MRRTDQRRAAVFALYQHDLTGRPVADTHGKDDTPFARALAAEAAARAPELDALIDRHAHGWDVERIQPLERSIMRVALLEILHPDSVPSDEPIPPRAVAAELSASGCVVTNDMCMSPRARTPRMNGE